MTERELDIVERIIERTAQELADRMEQIVPERVYDPDHAARLMGNTSKRAGKTLGEWDELELPKVPITPGGGKQGFYGRDLIRLIHVKRGPDAPKLEMAG